ncbi:ABC transporter permease subunit [Desulfovibrio sulfodismutans]|uniref:ABC transporter permease subunit n=1 Tax=Desulfolutivibrio sulfodismutans TaxID=63561 RepID=A0A7K3NNE0_9BACT|nr:ABC transporter permease subunit [Desulfolutivibrio sulfodismutans]NDY57706.1 ABC transporter permease subunit [Desulfolutivibrio sulfodismutans]QLA10908.1 ABC transporter permease subunit [Desulfolutivibrio sulfodismutans DSM 3696]
MPPRARHPFFRELTLTLGILSRNPSAVMGGTIIAAMVFLALFAPLLAPYDPVKLALPERLLAPGAAHFFGTDELGRDIFSRVLYGARISLSIGLLVISVAGGLGALIGATSGYFGGKIDSVVMRAMDVILSFPSLVLALALAAALGPSLINAIFATAFVMIPKFARMVRGEALSVRELPFVAASRVAGAGHGFIIRRHILPNCLNSAIVLATLTLGDAILIAASLSFIGLGAQPPTPEWGAMIASGRKFLMDQWWYATFPGLFILVTVIGFNIFGDALRDVLDPRIRR